MDNCFKGGAPEKFGGTNQKFSWEIEENDEDL